MEIKKQLERRRFKAKDEHGKKLWDITANSIVTAPAIEKNFQFFSKIPGLMFFFTQVSSTSHFSVDEERMEITGPAMVPDQEILRQDPETGEFYYCFFTQTDVEDFAEMFVQDANHNQANFEHGDEFTNQIKLKESWIVIDPANDKSSALKFTDVSKGTWFITYKVYDKELWTKVKESGFRGFSVEISQDAENNGTEKNSSYLLTNNPYMKYSLLKKLESLFNAAEQNYQDAKLKDGTAIRISGNLAAGAKVELIGTDGTLTPAPDGDLILEDGTVLKVTGGAISEIAAPKAEEAAKGEMTSEPEAKQEADPALAFDAKRVDALEVKMEEVINAVNLLVDTMNKEGQEMQKIKAENVELKAKNDELAKAASASPANFKKIERHIQVEFKNDKPLTLVERLAELRENKSKK